MKYRMNLREYLEKVPFKTENSSHYICECKFCVENENRHDLKCYIKKDYSVGFCFRCESVYINVEEQLPEEERATPISSFRRFKSSTLDYPTIDVSYYHESNDIDEVTKEYLHNRNPFLDYNKFRLKCRTNRVVIPFFYGDSVLYYQVRFINPIGNKYFNPPVDHKPVYMVPGQAITDTAILAEGTFDVMALDTIYGPEYTKIGLLGKTITASQMKFLKSCNFKKYIISLDETELSMKLRDKFHNELGGEIQVIHTEQDPEEYLRYK